MNQRPQARVAVAGKIASACPVTNTEPPVAYHETDAKSLLRRSAGTDPWFLGKFGMNLYRGCEHGCLYCDGRAERYYVTGVFDRDIQVKRNALELLRRELGRRREPGFVFVGGGVSDAYQPAERSYELARGALRLCRDQQVPVHLLTKSALVERDLDLLAEINEKSRAVLSFSIASTDERHRELFEPRAAPFAERWRVLARAKELGLGAGVMATPVLPGLSDQPESLSALVRAARDSGADFVCFGGLTLRPGIQKDTYLDVLRAAYPDLGGGYERLYAGERPSGIPLRGYLERLEERGREALAEYGMPGRMPRRLFDGLLPTYAEVGVLLEHRGFENGEPPGRGRLARAGWAVQEWARGRLAHLRQRDAFRLVEADLEMLVRSGALADVPGLQADVRPVVEEIFARVSG
jgi:DNA repair photolyase